MAKVQLLQRLRLVPRPAPDPVPRPSPKPIAAVQDADTAHSELPARPGARLAPVARLRARDRPLRLSLGLAAGERVQPLHLVPAHQDPDLADRRRRPGRADQPPCHAARLYQPEAALHHLPGPGSRLWLRHSRSRARAGGGAGSRFRRALLGLSGDRSQDRRLCRSRRHVRHQARLLPARRPRLERSQAGRHHRACSAARPISAPSSRACSSRTTRPTTRRSSRCSSRSWPIRSRSSTARSRPRTGPKIPSFPWIKLGDEEWKWVDPATFFDVLPQALDAARPLPGEEALYALVRSVLDAARSRPQLAQGAERGRRRGRRDAGEAAAPVPQFRHSAAAQLDHGDQQRRVRHRLSTPAPRSPSRTPSSTGRARRAISIRTSTSAASGSPAPRAIP